VKLVSSNIFNTFFTLTTLTQNIKILLRTVTAELKERKEKAEIGYFKLLLHMKVNNN